MKIINRRRVRIFAAGSLSAVAVALALTPFNMGGCSTAGLDVGQITNGAIMMGKSLSLSDKDEDSIGQSVALQATNRFRLYRDIELTRYVTLVAHTVGSVSSSNGLKWYVGVLDTDEVNAFSGPHGYIFITRGALKQMQNESELAGVLGHEIGHVCKQHGLNAVKGANFTNGFLTAAAGSEKHFAAFHDVADTATDAVILKGFSKQQEIEADAEGVKYAIAAGYDPNGFLHFLQRIEQEQSTGGKLFSTHPATSDRIKLVSAQIDKAGAGGQGATLPDRFHTFVTFKQ